MPRRRPRDSDSPNAIARRRVAASAKNLDLVTMILNARLKAIKKAMEDPNTPPDAVVRLTTEIVSIQQSETRTFGEAVKAAFHKNSGPAETERSPEDIMNEMLKGKQPTR